MCSSLVLLLPVAFQMATRGLGAQMVALELFTEFNCCVVFLGADLKERYYKGAPGISP